MLCSSQQFLCGMFIRIVPLPCNTVSLNQGYKMILLRSQAKSGQRKPFISTDPAGQVNLGSATWLTWESNTAVVPVITAWKWFPRMNIVKELNFPRNTCFQESWKGVAYVMEMKKKIFPFVSIGLFKIHLRTQS